MVEAHYWSSGVVKSFPKYGETAPLHPKQDLIELLKRHHTRDIHLPVYRVPGEDKIPRYGKIAARMNLGLEMHILAVDIDLPGHAAWESLEASHTGLRSALRCCPLAGGYTTPHGMRLLWVLEEPVPIPVATEYIKRWHKVLRQRGLNPDPQCGHWTAAYRLPNIKMKNEVRKGILDLYALESGVTLSFKPKRLTEKQGMQPKPAPPIAVNAENALSTVSERLQRDPESRRRFALYIGAEVDDNRVHNATCPGCGRESVWWLVNPDKDRHQYARCNHQNSCGWWGHLIELRSVNVRR